MTKILIDKGTLELALEALTMVKANADDWQQRTGKDIKGWMQPVNHALPALRQALEQSTEQEPVGITITGKLGNIYSFTSDYSLKKGDKVYTSPPQPQEAASLKPLTYEQLLEIYLKTNGLEFYKSFARAIEAKLKEKNENRTSTKRTLA